MAIEEEAQLYRDVALTQVAIARMEESLKSIGKQIDYSERSSEQLVKLIDERFTARFNAIDQRLYEMDKSRDKAKLATESTLKDLDTRLDNVEKWRDSISNKLIGFGIGIGITTGGVTAGLIKLIGG